MLFKNEFGDIIAWRAALAGVVVAAASLGLAVALFGRAPEATRDGREGAGPLYVYRPDIERHTPQEPPEEASEEPREMPAGAPAEAGSDETEAEAAPAPVEETPWPAGAEESAVWGSLTTEARDDLRAALGAWAEAGGMGAASFALESAEVTPEGTFVRLRVEGAGRATWLEAALPPGGAWQLTEHAQGFAPSPTEPIPVANAALLAQVTDDAVAAEVQRQLLASGLPGAESAWTTAASVAHEGAVWRLALWLPTGEAGASRYDAAFDASVGLLEISPAAEGAL